LIKKRRGNKKRLSLASGQRFSLATFAAGAGCYRQMKLNILRFISYIVYTQLYTVCVLYYGFATV